MPPAYLRGVVNHLPISNSFSLLIEGDQTTFHISAPDRHSPLQSMSVVPNDPSSLAEFPNSFDYQPTYDEDKTFYDLSPKYVSESEKECNNTSCNNNHHNNNNQGLKMERNHIDQFDSTVDTTAILKRSIFSDQDIEDENQWMTEENLLPKFEQSETIDPRENHHQWQYSLPHSNHYHHSHSHLQPHHHSQETTLTDISDNNNIYSRMLEENFGDEPQANILALNPNQHDLEFELERYDLEYPNQSSSSRSDSGIDSDSPINDEPITSIKQRPPGRRPPGRPPGTKSKKKLPIKIGRLWEFLRDLLHNPSYCPRLIEWEDPSIGTFRFKDSSQVAQLWGRIKKNESMNYEKLSRAMRYYYRTDVLRACVGKRLVYQFGNKAVNWRCANPNFMKSINKNMSNNNTKITCSTCDMVKTKRFNLKHLY